MTTPSKLGPAFLTVFGLPFVGMGLFAAYSFLQNANQPLPAENRSRHFWLRIHPDRRSPDFRLVLRIFPPEKTVGDELAHPGSPWLWRKDWAAGRVESGNKKSAIRWWVAAVLVNMLSLPASIGGISEGVKTQNPVDLFPVALGLLGLIVLFGAIRATIRFERFGKTYFEMTSLPFTPGSRLAGAIHVLLNTDAAHGVDLSLTCIRRVVVDAGKDSSTHEVPLWEDSKNVSSGSFLRGPLDTMIPVEFALPADAFQTNHDNPRDQVLWMLKAKADVAGVNYSDQFELPVFRTSSSLSAASSAGFADAAQFGSFAQTATTPGEASAKVSEPPRHRVVLSDSPSGLEFRFPAGRNIGRSVLVVSLAVALTALFYGMLRIQPLPPKFAFAIVGLLDFFLILAAIRAALSTTRIVVGNGTISWRRSIFGMGNSHSLQISDVGSIVAFTSIQQANTPGSTLYSLRLKARQGKATRWSTRSRAVRKRAGSSHRSKNAQACV